MAQKLVELTVNKLSILKNGAVTTPRGANLLTVSLVYPGPRQPSQTTVKAVEFKNKLTLDFVGLGYDERILFKEEIFYRSLLVVQLTDVEKPGAFDKVMRALFGAVFTAAWAALTGGISNVVLAATGGALGELHIESLKEAKNKVYVIGRAEKDLTMRYLPAKGKTKNLRMPLEVPKDISRMVSVFKPGASRPHREERFVMKEGDPNGWVEMTVRTI